MSDVVCVRPLQAGRGGEEEAHLPRPRLREDVQENVAAQSSRAAAHRREALRLQLGVLRETFHTQRRAAAARQDAHGSVCPDGRHEGSSFNCSTGFTSLPVFRAPGVQKQPDPSFSSVTAVSKQPKTLISSLVN